MKLEFRTVELQLEHPWSISRTTPLERISVVDVVLDNEEGVLGLGEAAPIGRYNESTVKIEAFFGKINPNRLFDNDIERANDHLSAISDGSLSAMCAVNLALLDLQAKLAQKPVHEFLGLGFREGHHLTSFTIGVDKPERIRAKVLEAESYPILKMKVGVPGDKANMAALRQVAPTKPVRLDANEGWGTKEEALGMIEWFAKDKHIELVEQPMPASQPVTDWIWLKARSPLPIFADESYHLASDADQAAHCFHGVNVKLVKSGGITPAIAALKAARRCGLKTMLGCMIETSLLISAGAHLAELCDYLDLDGNLLIRNDPYVGVTASQGMLSFGGAPEKFGLRVSPRG